MPDFVDVRQVSSHDPAMVAIRRLLVALALAVVSTAGALAQSPLQSPRAEPFRVPSPDPALFGRTIHFAPGSDILDDKALETLGRHYLMLKDFPFERGRISASFDDIEVENHKAGVDLSIRRAMAVMRVYESFGFKRQDFEIVLVEGIVLRTGDPNAPAPGNRTVTVYPAIPQR